MNKLKTINPFAKIVLMYVGLVIGGMFILKLPFLFNDGQSISYLDSMFTSISSFATTGLSVIDVKEVYNYFGWTVLIIFFNIGGMGIMTINTILFLLIGKKVGIKNRYLAKIDQNNLTTEDMVTVLVTILKMFVFFEFLGTTLVFLKSSYMYSSILERFMNSWFMATSAISGSGFYDTVPFAHDYFILFILMLLMIFSFIGYPVLLDIKEYIKFKKTKSKRKYKWSTFTKIVVKVNIITVVLFAVIFFFLEYDHAMLGKDLFDQIYYSLYLSISTKSVGLNVFADINSFRNITLLFSIIFMIIGGSPSSACGGIRVTTVYVIYIQFKSQVKGQSQAIFDRSYIKVDTVLKAFYITFMFLFIAFIGFLMILFFNKDVNEFKLFYDVISAITTTGFSTGALDQLNNIGVFIMVVLMLIGRVGVVNLINALHKKEKKAQRIEHVEKDIVI